MALVESYTISENMKASKKSQLASPDSTNNNNTSMNNNNTTGGGTFVTTTRGRGRKSEPTFAVQVIPGQPLSVARRNARERNRVKQVNNGFSTLRQHIPFTARNKKMSKVETLRCAVEYIRSLQQLLDENGGYERGNTNADLDLSQNMSSSSPISMDSDDNNSLMSTNDLQQQQQMILQDTEYATATNDYVIRRTNNYEQLYADEQQLLQHHIRQGSSLSPGYSDRSSIDSPHHQQQHVHQQLLTDVTTTGFMGVFAAAASGAGLIDLKNTELLNGNNIIFKKEIMDDNEDANNTLLQLENVNTNDIIMDAALTWWEVENGRRILQQTPTTT